MKLQRYTVLAQVCSKYENEKQDIGIIFPLKAETVVL